MGGEVVAFIILGVVALLFITSLFGSGKKDEEKAHQDNQFVNKQDLPKPPDTSTTPNGKGKVFKAKW